MAKLNTSKMTDGRKPYKNEGIITKEHGKLVLQWWNDYWQE